MIQERVKAPFTGYEYKEVTVSAEQASMSVDCYQNFGWLIEESMEAGRKNRGYVTIRMKRDQKIVNRMELTRLQRNYEACVEEIKMLEQEKTKTAFLWALAAGIIGTIFIGGSTFAVTHEPPVIWLCVLLAIPGIAGWVLPCFLYREIVKVQTRRIQPLIEEKREEIYKVCEKGYSLL